MAILRFTHSNLITSVLACAALVFCGCGPLKDRFTLTDKDIDATGANSVGGEFAWTLGNLGTAINGHGLPETVPTFVVIRTPRQGHSELIWPDFVYGDNQANIAILGDTVVFTARLPDGKLVLMADQPGQPPIIISPAILRIAAKKLGSSVLMPGQEYEFTKVRQPPDRIWLQCQPVSSQYFPQQQLPTFELTISELTNTVAETKAKAKMFKAGRFDYLAEDGVPCAITSADIQSLGIPAIVTNHPVESVIHKTTGYVPQAEELWTGDVLLDCSNNYAYFSTVHEPGRILKVKLGDQLSTPPVVVGAVILEGDENNTHSAVLDQQNRCAYYATDFPGHIVKLALGDSNQPPYRVSAVLINPDESVGAGVFDTANGNLYFNARNVLYKLNPGTGTAPPSIESHLNGIYPSSAVIDSLNHYAYFGGDPSTGSAGPAIVKVALSSNGPPRFVNQLILANSPGDLRGAIIAPESGYAWFTGNDGVIEKVSLGRDQDAPKLVGALKIESRFDYLETTFGKDNEGFGYYGTQQGGKAGDPVERIAAIVKVALGTGDQAPRVVSYLALPRGYTITGGAVDPLHRILIAGMSVTGDSSADACYKIVKFDLGRGTAAPRIASDVKLAK